VTIFSKYAQHCAVSLQKLSFLLYSTVESILDRLLKQSQLK